VGCEPKPQQRARVVGSHEKANQRYKGHHGHDGHHRHRQEPQEDLEGSKASQAAKKFRLWADGPNFDIDLRQNVIALVGRTAYLTCRVLDRGNNTVIIMSIIGDFVRKRQTDCHVCRVILKNSKTFVCNRTKWHGTSQIFAWHFSRQNVFKIMESCLLFFQL
jgi:hypothetical protein